MRGLVLFSYAVCLAVVQAQYNYGQGIAQLPESPAVAQQFQPLELPLASASGQLDQSTIDILRQLPSVPTSSSFLLHESHQTLTNAATLGNELNSIPVQAFLQRAPSASLGAPQQAQFANFQPFGPSSTDSSSDSNLASSPLAFEPSFIASAPASAPSQQPALEQPSGPYQTAQFPDPITTIHKHIYIHAPPAEFEEAPQPARVRADPPNNQKHVQILFIKAPAPPTPKPGK